ncbi:hypothetical protein GY26_16245 [Gammaproteobacteria bacterium MFB021]|nr:hypothetical protein GY26_16245 [Gammaproteobacteria bacterium MFB021]
MAERPILFNDGMVRAILDGRKTQTRRALKHQPPKGCGAIEGPEMFAPTVYVRGEEQPGPEVFGAFSEDGEWSVKCPYGQPGDRLWVREAFALLGNEDGACVDWDDNLQKGDERAAARIYRASCERAEYGLWRIPDKAPWKPYTNDLHYDGAWRPSIHMPRWASRILLEVTAVRVERLQEISEADAKAEGIQPAPGGWWSGADGQSSPTPAGAYALLWESINGAGSWATNPWVWVVEFRVIEPSEVAS